MLYYESKSTDPYLNLATEQYLFDSIKAQDIFMLWQNDNAVIIGKNQNTEAEINRAFVEERGIRVARRLSGGGAVYHDMGNLNFTFIMSDDGLDELNFQHFCQPVLKTLSEFGVKAETHGRNDITVDGKKFSGNAQYRKNGRIMHHGTTMFNSDLDVLQQALSPPEMKVQSKGVASVRSRVTNIGEHMPSDITLEIFKNALVKHVLPQGFEEYEPSDADIKHIAYMRDTVYDTWQWNFGASPQYNIVKKRRVEGCGILEFYLDIKHGKIVDMQCFGDFFGDNPCELLIRMLIDCELRPDAMATVLADIDISKYFYNLNKPTFIDILCS